jgi:hypothetical protein
MDGCLPSETEAGMRLNTLQRVHSQAPVHKKSIRIALLLLAPFVYCAMLQGQYIDDSYITLSYVKTLTDYHVWGMAANHLSNAATSALNVILLSALATIVRSPTGALYIFNVALIFLTYFLLRRIGSLLKASSNWPLVATVLLFSNPLLISTLGLESYLFLVVLLGICISFTEQRYALTGLLVGLLYMTRPEGAFAGVIVVVTLLRGKNWRGLVFIVPAAAIILMWSIVSWKYLGSIVPDTFFIKRSQASWGGYNFFNGIFLYLFAYPVATFLSFFLAAAIALNTGNRDYRRNSIVYFLAIFTAAHFVAYSAMGVPPYHWYYAPEAALATLIGSLALSTRLRDNARIHSVVFYSIAAINLAIVFMTTALTHHVPIQTNWGTVTEYKEIAQWINSNIESKTILLKGELGVIQYYTDADMINDFSDRKFIPALLGSKSPPVMRKILALNFRHAVPLATNGIPLTLGPCRHIDGAIKTWETTSPWIGRRQWCLTGTDTNR